MVFAVVPTGVITQPNGVMVFKYNQYDTVDLQQLAMRFEEPGLLTDAQIQGVITAYSAILARRHQIFAHHMTVQSGTTPYLDSLSSHLAACMANQGASRPMHPQQMLTSIPAQLHDSVLQDLFQVGQIHELGQTSMQIQTHRLQGYSQDHSQVDHLPGLGDDFSLFDHLQGYDHNYIRANQLMQPMFLPSEPTASPALSHQQAMGRMALDGIVGPNLSHRRDNERHDSSALFSLVANSSATADNSPTSSPTS